MAYLHDEEVIQEFFFLLEMVLQKLFRIINNLLKTEMHFTMHNIGLKEHEYM